MGVTSAAEWSAGLDRRRPVARHARGHRPPLHLGRPGDVPLHAGHGRPRRSPAKAFARRRSSSSARWSAWRRRLRGLPHGRCSASACWSRVPREQAHELRDRLADLGAEVLVQPGIEIGPPPDWAAVDAALARLDHYDWLVFSSGNGVRYFLDRLLAGGGDLRRLGGVKLAAIGPGTAAELAALSSQGRPGAGRVSRRVAGRGAFAGRCAGQAFPLGPRRSRPAGLARAVGGRRRRGGPGRGLFDDRGRPVPTRRSWRPWRRAASTG